MQQENEEMLEKLVEHEVAEENIKKDHNEIYRYTKIYEDTEGIQKEEYQVQEEEAVTYDYAVQLIPWTSNF